MSGGNASSDTDTKEKSQSSCDACDIGSEECEEDDKEILSWIRDYKPIKFTNDAEVKRVYMELREKVQNSTADAVVGVAKSMGKQFEQVGQVTPRCRIIALCATASVLCNELTENTQEYAKEEADDQDLDPDRHLDSDSNISIWKRCSANMHEITAALGTEDSKLRNEAE